MSQSMRDFGSVRASMMTRLTIEYTDHSDSFPAYSCNVSYGGMGFYSTGPVQSDREVVIKIWYTPHTDLGLAETVNGTVKWCKPIGQLYGAGVEFTGLHSNHQPLLYSYIESALEFHHVKLAGEKLTSARSKRNGR